MHNITYKASCFLPRATYHVIGLFLRNVVNKSFYLSPLFLESSIWAALSYWTVDRWRWSFVWIKLSVLKIVISELWTRPEVFCSLRMRKNPIRFGNLWCGKLVWKTKCSSAVECTIMIRRFRVPVTGLLFLLSFPTFPLTLECPQAGVLWLCISFCDLKVIEIDSS